MTSQALERLTGMSAAGGITSNNDGSKATHDGSRLPHPYHATTAKSTPAGNKQNSKSSSE